MNHNVQFFIKCYDSLVQVPFREDESVQLFRVAFFRSDFLLNPYFNRLLHCPIVYAVSNSQSNRGITYVHISCF